MAGKTVDKKVLLMILDGWGKGDHSKGDVVWSAHPEYLNALEANYPHAQLRTDGENVGLPAGQMGNSEVGHLNIGAGRVVYQDLMKINRAIADGSIAENPEIKAVFEYARSKGTRIHFMGLVSDGGVHSSLEHLFKLCDLSEAYGIPEAYVHCFMDGRDTDPHSGKGFIGALQRHIYGTNVKIASVIGRYYAMDRDKRWERVRTAYDQLVNGVGEKSTDLVASILKSYDNGVTDEFIKPIVAVDERDEAIGTIKNNDAVIFFNFRNDRAKELTIALTQEDMPAEGMHTLPLYYCTMTPYDAKFRGLHILFDKENVQNTIGEYVASLGLNQLRIAETEKYAHVTFFFNGGVEKPNPLEDRILIPSPKVATYDLKPEMSAYEVTEAVIKEIESLKYDCIILNFANADMVGHTGNFDAAVKAVEAVDKCVGKIVSSMLAAGGQILMTADHGNADVMTDESGNPVTSHSTNPVPLSHIAADPRTLAGGGRLCDVAPTMLKLMGLAIPAEMTGNPLV